jgi:cytochrome c biogenesis protein
MGLLAVWQRFYKTLASIRTGIVLLILVGILSAVGTLVLQRPTSELQDLQRAYSPSTLLWLDRLGLTDVFHAWWFAMLLTLVSLSIIFASIDRWPSSWKFYAHPYRRAEAPFRSTLQHRAEFKILDRSAALDAAERALIKLRLRPERVEGNDEVSLYCERNRFSVMAVYVIHISLLMIFAGGIVDAVVGYRGNMNLTKGETSNTISIRQNGKAFEKKLPFAIRCDNAGQENYADGTPKKWWSNLVVVDGGRELERKQIVVNDPLTYQGIRFYQASFGMSGKLDQLQLQVSPVGKGDAKTIWIGLNQTLPLDAENSVTLTRFVPDYYIQDNEVHQRSSDPENPAVELTLASKDGPHHIWFFLRERRSTEDSKMNYALVPTDMKMSFFTGLEVSHEPGQWCVWAGVLLMAIGLCVAFYVIHMRFWVTAVFDPRQGLVLWIGGACNKNRERFAERFQQVAEAIGNELTNNGDEPEQKQEEPTKEESLAGV